MSIEDFEFPLKATYKPTEEDVRNEDSLIIFFVERACMLSDKTNAIERIEVFKKNLKELRLEQEGLFLTDLDPALLGAFCESCQSNPYKFYKSNTSVICDINALIPF